MFFGKTQFFPLPYIVETISNKDLEVDEAMILDSKYNFFDLEIISFSLYKSDLKTSLSSDGPVRCKI